MFLKESFKAFSIALSINIDMNINFLNYTINCSFPKWPVGNQIIVNTINPHSFCVAENDMVFKQALMDSELLIPDGIGIVMAIRILNNIKTTRITGADMHLHLLEQANKNRLKVFYLGSSKATLKKIEKRISVEYPLVRIKSFSPKFKNEFSSKDNLEMVNKVNEFSPDILFVGMTAPKQEKWVYLNKTKLDTKIITSIGAVFDFYAGTVSRAPNWIINLGLEWFYRLIREPRRLWKRYLINNTKFSWYIFVEKVFK